MGARLTKFEFKPKPNEEIDAIIKIPKEQRSAIHGVVVDWCGKPVKNAVVKLFLKKTSNKKCTLKPLTHTFTDDCGQFLFGPLNPGRCYVVKVWYADPVCNNEIVVNPEDCQTNDDHHEDGCNEHCSCSDDYSHDDYDDYDDNLDD